MRLGFGFGRELQGIGLWGSCGEVPQPSPISGALLHAPATFCSHHAPQSLLSSTTPHRDPQAPALHPAMATACTLSCRSVAPSAPCYPAQDSCSPLASSMPAGPCKPVTYEVPAAYAIVGAPVDPLEPAPSTPVAYQPYPTFPCQQPSVSFSYDSVPPPAPAAQYSYGVPLPMCQQQQQQAPSYAAPCPPADAVRPGGCFGGCTAEQGATIGAVLGVGLAFAGVIALNILRLAILF